jgi:hypothetical protein
MKRPRRVQGMDIKKKSTWGRHRKENDRKQKE